MAGSFIIFLIFCYIVYNLKKASSIIIELFPSDDHCSNLMELYSNHPLHLMNEAKNELSVIHSFIHKFHS